MKILKKLNKEKKGYTTDLKLFNNEIFEIIVLENKSKIILKKKEQKKKYIVNLVKNKGQFYNYFFEIIKEQNDYFIEIKLGGKYFKKQEGKLFKNKDGKIVGYLFVNNYNFLLEMEENGKKIKMINIQNNNIEYMNIKIINNNYIGNSRKYGKIIFDTNFK